MHKSAMKCNKTIGKWCKNKHGASKIIDTFETYQIYSTTASKASGVKSLYIRNDPTSAKIKERTEEHIQTGKSSHLIATSHYRVFAMVRSTS
jgi:hypothetical protein